MARVPWRAWSNGHSISCDPLPRDPPSSMQTWRGRKRNRPGPDDEGALHAALEKQQPDPAAYRQALNAAQPGTPSTAGNAPFTGRPQRAGPPPPAAGLPVRTDPRAALRGARVD